MFNKINFGKIGDSHLGLVSIKNNRKGRICLMYMESDHPESCNIINEGIVSDTEDEGEKESF